MDAAANTRRVRARCSSVMVIVIAVACACLAACGTRTDPLCTTCDPTGGGSISTGDASFEGSSDGSIGDDARSSDGARGDGGGADSVVRDGMAFDTALPPDVIAFDTTPPPPGCPTALPRDGSPCDKPLDCEYASCDPTTNDRATCTGGMWKLSAVACTSVCPIAEPASGTPCTLPPRVGCTWSSDCTLIVAVGFCVDGKWSVKAPAGCQPKECPASEPVEGTKCPPTTPGFGFTCIYINECAHVDTMNCDGDTWSDEDRQACSAPPPCPSSPPTPGSSCTGRFSCGYVNVCGTIDSYDCSGDWIEWPGVCATPACPPTPSDLDRCTIEGTTCRYPDGAGCELDCTCTSGKFECTQPPCGAH
jgi:hypothetical protein